MNDITKTHGYLPVFAAITGNFLIMILKWVGFFVTGSGSLFSEAVHSVADVFNQLLLMVGIKRSTKKADHDYPYGYGQERFFWALVSACSIFFMGAGVTVYHGIAILFDREELHIGLLAYVILAISFVVELFTFYLAYRELTKKNPGKSFKEILTDGDSATIAVLYEDGVAVIGVLIAFLSILLTALTGETYWDAFGSIVIGVLLGVMAVVLVNKNRTILIGKAMPEEIKEKALDILQSDPAVEKVVDFKSGILDVGKYQMKSEIEFNGTAILRKIYRPNELANEYESIKEDYQEFLRFCADNADRVSRAIGNEIDTIEDKIKEEIPEIRHIDIEIN